jgi:hypothetical protein
MILQGFEDLHPTTRRLLVARALRSIGQGVLVADFALYLGEDRRGLATSLNTVSFQFPQSVGPSVAGYLLDEGLFTLPFFAAAGLQAIYLIFYERVFRNYEPPRQRDPNSFGNNSDPL